MEDIEERIVVEQALTPVDIHERYKVLNGAIYGLASHGAFTGAFKPGKPVEGGEGAVSLRRRGASGPGHADGDDVGLDRGRRARPGCGLARHERGRASAAGRRECRACARAAE
jgi:hypothetical protein